MAIFGKIKRGLSILTGFSILKTSLKSVRNEVKNTIYSAKDIYDMTYNKEAETEEEKKIEKRMKNIEDEKERFLRIMSIRKIKEENIEELINSSFNMAWTYLIGVILAIIYLFYYMIYINNISGYFSFGMIFITFLALFLRESYQNFILRKRSMISFKNFLLERNIIPKLK